MEKNGQMELAHQCCWQVSKIPVNLFPNTWHRECFNQYPQEITTHQSPIRVYTADFLHLE